MPIYVFALPTETQEFRFSFGIYQPVPVLLQLCQQTRHEATNLYYSDAGFELIVHHNYVKHLTGWLKGLSSEARLSIVDNKNINLRIFYDRYQKHYDEFAHFLGEKTWGTWYPPWCASVESFEEGRSAFRPYSAAIVSRNTRVTRRRRRGTRCT